MSNLESGAPSDKETQLKIEEIEETLGEQEIDEIINRETTLGNENDP